jgi:hypothetical protein
MNEINKDKILHGNSAKINPQKPITPLFGGNAAGDYDNALYMRGYNRAGLRHSPDPSAEFLKDEVDSIRL